MKKIFVFMCAVAMSSSVFAQTAAIDTVVRRGGIFGLNFNQVNLTNWAAGGDNTLAGNVLLSLFSNYKKGKWSIDYTGDFAFGGAKIAKQTMRKTDDKIDINAKWGYDIGKNFYLTYLLGFKTQFTEGFNYVNDTTRVRISNLLTPGYVLNSIGIDWKPKDYFSAFFSPVTIKTTMVNDKLLVNEAKDANISLYGVDAGKKVRNEVGAYFQTQFKKEVVKNITLATKLELFSNYSKNPQNIDVNWGVVIAMKVNKFINALIQTDLIYDDDIIVPKSDKNAAPGPGTQFKEVFGVGFSYKFSGYSVK